MGRRSLLPLMLLCTSLGGLLPVGAEANRLSVSRAARPGRLLIAVRATPCAKKAVFYIDHRRSWVDHTYRWRFGQRGFLAAKGLDLGRHRVAVNVIRQDHTFIHSVRIAALTRRPGGGVRWKLGVPQVAVADDPPSASPATGTPGKALDPGAPSRMRGPVLAADPPVSVPPPPPAPETPPAPVPEASRPSEPPQPPPAPAEPEPEAQGDPNPPPPPQPQAEGSPPPPQPPPPPAEEPSPPPPPPPADPEPPAPTFIDAGFENGLSNWSIAGVGEEIPTVVEDIVDTGTKSGRVVLSGDENRSELILAEKKEIAEFPPGTERWYAFSINVCTMIYGRPGAHNLIMQLKSDNEGSPRVSLGLWDYEGKRGLWSEGDVMGGNQFLAPLTEKVWHDILVHFKVTTDKTGFYEIYLDGRLVDSRSDISVLRPGAENAYIKTGLYRNGGEIPGLSEIRIDSAKLGMTREEVTAP